MTQVLQDLKRCLSETTKTNRNQTECLDLLSAVPYWLQPDVIEMIVGDFSSPSNPAQKEVLLEVIHRLAPEHVNRSLDDLLPYLIRLTSDTSGPIAKLALKVAETTLGHCQNRDLTPLLPVLLLALRDPLTTPSAIQELASCVFVQNVEASTLAVLNPLLRRGLRSPTNEIKRKSCVILDNICKLVDDPREIHRFAIEILPPLRNVAENVSHPEVRDMANRALRTLLEAHDERLPPLRKTLEEILVILDAASTGHPLGDELRMSSARVVRNLCAAASFDLSIWNSALEGLDHTILQTLHDQCLVSLTPKDLFFEDTDEGADLYRGTFSLAYGTLTLLKNTNLHLKRNRFYGLLGPNNCGKTTLMRAIHNEQIEGFPKKEELKTVFVEHEIQEREVGEDAQGYPIFNTDLSGVEWVMDYCQLMGTERPREVVESTMGEIGFATGADQKQRAADAHMPVTTYSGGWKMKMQLCAAKLLDADILMLDEPTGHMDVKNVQWLKDWLRSFLARGGSIITTSHDSDFLNEMCTHIIDFQKRKLVMFKGSLTGFVEKFPEKKNYFILSNDVVRFEFPEPGPLEGVKSLSKTLLKMSNCTFQYPTRDAPTVEDICLDCSRVSRVAVVGPNGAGKSTAIKMLIGELQPTSGVVVKHPNLRIAYVAQHAFHHLEKHMNRTPVQYIMWRFAGFEDKESVELLNKKPEDETPVEKFYLKDNLLYECHSPQELAQAVEPESLHGRHEKSKEYEVKWKDRSPDATTWVHRDVLVRMGALKLVQKYDERMAAEGGLMKRPLTTKAITEHLARFGLSAEDAGHTLIRSLSGGQKIKVVIGASMWLNPHLVILDEPTNYLDRDSLGALTKAIHEFRGGVIIISHNREFADAVCQEKWVMDKGRLRREGESLGTGDEAEAEKNSMLDQGDTVVDACGNTHKVEKRKSAKELKQEIKKLTKLMKSRGLSEDQLYQYETEMDKLREQLDAAV